MADIDPLAGKPIPQFAPTGIASTSDDHGNARTEAGGCYCLIRTLPPWECLEHSPKQRFAWARYLWHPHDQVHIQAANNKNMHVFISVSLKVL